MATPIDAGDRSDARGAGTWAGWAFVAAALLAIGALVVVRRGDDSALPRALESALASARALTVSNGGRALSMVDLEPRGTEVSRYVTYVVEPLGTALVDGSATFLQAEIEHEARALPEGEASASKGTALPALTETDRRQRAYRRYLNRHGWRPLKEVLEEMNQ